MVPGTSAARPWQRAVAVLTAAWLAVLVVVASAEPARAQDRIIILRDAESEYIIRAMAAPILSAAGLSPAAVNFLIVSDPRLNAFVGPGQTVYIHTGLLTAVRDPGELLGVVAHEIGHVAGGHYTRAVDQMERSRTAAIITSLLGVAAAIATGEGAFVGAGAAGASSIGSRSFLGFTRAMESQADQAALRFLDRAGMSAEGLLSFMRVLEDQELVPVDRQAEYMRTHPFSRDRVETIRSFVAQSPNTGRPLDERIVEMMDRLQAKLLGYISPVQALRRFEGQTTVAARYGTAVAHWRSGRLDLALQVLNGLVAEEPRNPFFYEIRGQMLFENGRIADARADYEIANTLLPNNPLLLVPLAQTQIEGGNPAELPIAIQTLSRAVTVPGGATPLAWRLLATAYGRSGDTARASVALAEEALARGDTERAREQAIRALRGLPEGSPGWIQAHDIIQSLDRN